MRVLTPLTVTSKVTLLLLFLLTTVPVFAQLEPIGIFEHHQDVGDPTLKGSAVYDKENQIYTLSAGGKNMWYTADQLHFAWKKIKGDFNSRHRKVHWQRNRRPPKDRDHCARQPKYRLTLRRCLRARRYFDFAAVQT